MVGPLRYASLNLCPGKIADAVQGGKYKSACMYKSRKGEFLSSEKDADENYVLVLMGKDTNLQVHCILRI